MPGWVDYDRAMYGTGDLDELGVKVALDEEGPPLDPDAELAGRGRDRARACATTSPTASPRSPTRRCARRRAAATSSRPTRTSSPPATPSSTRTWLLGGGSGHGFKHGPAIAELMAAALAGEAPMPERFALGERAPGRSLRTAGSGVRS